MNLRLFFVCILLSRIFIPSAYDSSYAQELDRPKQLSQADSLRDAENEIVLNFFKPDSLTFVRFKTSPSYSHTIEIPFKADSSELHTPMLSEPAERYLLKLRDTDKAFPLTDIIRQLIAGITPDKKARLDFIPSRTQIHALSTLWQKGKATQLELYAELDSTFQLTLEDLEREMAFLEERGLVDRQIISPKNELMIGIGPIPLKPVELSPTNRRNRVYLYSPRLKKEQLSNYLQARLYEAKLNPSRNPELAHKLQHLYHTLYESQP